MEPELKEAFDKQNKVLFKIERGLYGDPDNKVEGIIDKITKHDDLYRVIEFVVKRPKLTGALVLICIFLLGELGHRGLTSLLSFVAKF